MNLAFADAPFPSRSADSAAAKPARIVADILRAAHSIRGALATHFAEFNLSDARYAVLQIVRDASPRGCTQTELAERLRQSESSVSTLVDRMRTGNLLYRLRSKLDRRKCLLILTDHARETLDRLEQCHHERMADLLSCFSSGQLDGLASLLTILDDELTRREASTTTTSAPTAPAVIPHPRLSESPDEGSLRPAG